MDSFERWLQTNSHPGVKKYANILLQLGASWETFQRERNEVINDLVSSEIPRLVASDIVTAAMEALRRMSRPLSIFWDIENIPVPSGSSGTEVASRLRSVLSAHGNLVQFRGYASIGLNQIPEQKRSELHLSGCHLVDCPHVGRKEVADKMIIVDAMEFAFMNITDGATLVFITNDVDYAYLLAKLKKPQWKTIVISKVNHESMLHVSCGMHLQWETDILQLPKSFLPHPPGSPGFFTIDKPQTPLTSQHSNAKTLGKVEAPEKDSTKKKLLITTILFPHLNIWMINVMGMIKTPI